MKIGFCTPGGTDFEDYKGNNLLGIESQIFGLAKELVNNDFDVYIFRRWNNKEKKIEIIEGVKIININSYEFPDNFIQKALTKITFSYYVKKEIERLKMDIVVMTEIFSSYFVSYTEIPKIYVTHNPPSDFPSDYPLKKGILDPKFIKKNVEKRIYNNCNVLIALNSSIKNYLESKGFKVIQIPNGIDFDSYNFNLNHSNYIIAVGRLIKLKGMNYLVKAYSNLNEETKSKYKLIIVGYGSEEKTLKNMVKVLKVENRIEFIEWLPKDILIKKISECSVFVFPSLFETFGIVLIEAMACGKPTISSDISSFKEIITDHLDGLLFEKKNVKELEKSLEYLLTNEDERKRIGKNARETVEKKYDFRLLVEDYIKIFNAILSESK